MKIKNLTQKGKYVLVASILGMATTSLFAAPAELGGVYRTGCNPTDCKN